MSAYWGKWIPKFNIQLSACMVNYSNKAKHTVGVIESTLIEQSDMFLCANYSITTDWGHACIHSY